MQIAINVSLDFGDFCEERRFGKLTLTGQSESEINRKVARNLIDNFMQMNGLTSTKDKEIIKK